MGPHRTEQGSKEHPATQMEAQHHSLTTTPDWAGPSAAAAPAAEASESASAAAPAPAHAPATLFLPQAHSQSQCLFLTLLPLEIRQMIYHYAFQGTIHIISIYPKPSSSSNSNTSNEAPSRSGKLAHVRCDRLEEEIGQEQGEKGTDEYPHLDSMQPCWTRQRAKVHGIRYYNSTGGDSDQIPPDNLLALVLTCRRISTESHPYLYSTPHFDFNSETTLLAFLHSYSQIPSYTFTNTNTSLTSPTHFHPPTSWYLSKISSLSFHLTHPRTPRLRSEVFTSRFPTWSAIWDLIAMYMIPQQTHWKYPRRGRLQHIRLRIDIGGGGRYREKSLFRNARQECEFFGPVGRLKGRDRREIGLEEVGDEEDEKDGLRSFVMETSWPVAPEVLEILPRGSKVGRLGEWFETDG